jgi:hypothetical protein
LDEAEVSGGASPFTWSPIFTNLAVEIFGERAAITGTKTNLSLNRSIRHACRLWTKYAEDRLCAALDYLAVEADDPVRGARARLYLDRQPRGDRHGLRGVRPACRCCRRA